MDNFWSNMTKFFVHFNVMLFIHKKSYNSTRFSLDFVKPWPREAFKKSYECFTGEGSFLTICYTCFLKKNLGNCKCLIGFLKNQLIYLFCDLDFTIRVVQKREPLTVYRFTLDVYIRLYLGDARYLNRVEEWKRHSQSPCVSLLAPYILLHL